MCNSQQGCVLNQGRLHVHRANDKPMSQACIKCNDLAPIEFMDAFADV